MTPRRYAAGRSRVSGVSKLPSSPLPIKLLPDRFAEPVRHYLPLWAAVADRRNGVLVGIAG